MQKSVNIAIIMLILGSASILQQFAIELPPVEGGMGRKDSMQIPQMKNFESQGYTSIGYYTNSSSTFSNAAYYLLKHGALGNIMIPFNDLTDLSTFSMIIVPFKENWTSTEIISLTNFLNQGGIAFLTETIPPGLLDVTITARNGLWITPTDRTARTPVDKLRFHLAFNYSKAFLDKIQWKYYPFDDPYERLTKYISAIGEPEIEILFTAQKDGTWSSLPDTTDYIGYTVVTKKIGAGRIAYSTIPLFDHWAMRASGGPTLPVTNRGGLWSGGGKLGSMADRLLTQLFLMESKTIPTRWHTPYA
ncbi:MAG: hypothetical protein ACXAEI_11490, partial [Candidatus Hodarchaeales archaeon]